MARFRAATSIGWALSKVYSWGLLGRTHHRAVPRTRSQPEVSPDAIALPCIPFHAAAVRLRADERHRCNPTLHLHFTAGCHSRGEGEWWGLWACQIYARDLESPPTALNKVSNSLHLCNFSHQASAQCSMNAIVRFPPQRSGHTCWRFSEGHSGGPAKVNKVRMFETRHMLNKQGFGVWRKLNYKDIHLAC